MQKIKLIDHGTVFATRTNQMNPKTLPLPIFFSLITACSVGNKEAVDANAIVSNTYKEPFEDGVYIVDGDTPVENKKLLLALLEEDEFTRSLTIHANRGVAAKWPESQQSQLTYCISNDFGPLKPQMVTSMNEAVEAWEAAADIDFIHLPEQDETCTQNNNNVIFDVRPTSDAPYLARAFFPGQSRSTRNIIVDNSAFNSSTSLAGIIRHELGHTIGFRHEHTRAEAPPGCYEDSSWIAVTSYDSSSVMHYPQCGGTNPNLILSSLDKLGVAETYGSPIGSESPSTPPLPETPKPTPETVDDEKVCEANHNGTLSQGEIDTYIIENIQTGLPVQITMSGIGDADLYVRFNNQPTGSRFDCRPYKSDSNEACDLDVPQGAESVHILIHAYRNASYDLSSSWSCN